ncbi:hypothetical protein SO802_028803 [Lithocarpus litseifolius]|uniref:Uncharacterized protein n=1 Tax=Lithocarpus litseifolius TaxID=425828 RepID=A0AAW2BUU8_9ROSI
MYTFVAFLSTPAKALENADMAGSRPYTWSGCEQGKGKSNGIKGSLVHANDVITLGEVRFAPIMDTKHSQKGDSDPFWSEV